MKNIVKELERKLSMLDKEDLEKIKKVVAELDKDNR